MIRTFCLAVLLSAPLAAQSPLTIDVESVAVIDGQAEPFAGVVILRGENRQITSAALVTITASPNSDAVVRARTVPGRKRVEVKRENAQSLRHLIMPTAEQYGLIEVFTVVIDIIDGKPDLEWFEDEITIGKPGEPPPPDPGTFEDLFKKSQELSLKVGAPKKRAELAAGLLAGPINGSIQDIYRAIHANFRKIVAKPVAGEPIRGNWLDDWLEPITTDLNDLVASGAITEPIDYAKAWKAIEAGLK